MSDIVERLHGWSGQASPVSSTDIYAMTQEAAAEIKRLEFRIKVEQSKTRIWDEEAARLKAEVERLRTENAGLRRALDVVPGKPTEEDIEWGRRVLTNGEVAKLLADKDAEIEQLTKECEEQARLNGMGAERELALRAEIERLTKEANR
jgi:predicted RNase H-like nuclease (RuvC/YqgF family)